MVDSRYDNIWTEKYRPKKLDDLCINPKTKKIIESWGQEIPHLLFTSSPGQGKTTISQILVKDILDCDYIYINASDENGIDTVRNKISGFIQTKSFDGNLKVVVLDECLEENTLVDILRDGDFSKIPIKDLNPSTDLVKSYCFKKGRVEYRPFEMKCNGLRDLYEIELSNGEHIRCTDTHKWYVEYRGEIVRMSLKEIMSKEITEILSI